MRQPFSLRADLHVPHACIFLPAALAFLSFGVDLSRVRVFRTRPDLPCQELILRLFGNRRPTGRKGTQQEWQQQKKLISTHA